MLFNVKEMSMSTDSSPAVLPLLSPCSVSSIRLYGQETHSTYDIKRHGIAYNSASEKDPFYNHWVITKNIFSGSGQVLFKDGIWRHKGLLNADNQIGYYFSSADEAFMLLYNHANEILSATGDDKSILKSLFDSTLTVKDIESDLKKINWFIWQENGAYSDLETEIILRDGNGKYESISLNLHCSFDWEDNKVFLTLGDNLGDGFNDKYYLGISIFDNKLFSRIILDSILEDLFMSEGKAIAEWKSYSTGDDLLCAIKELASRADALQQYFKLTVKKEAK